MAKNATIFKFSMLKMEMGVYSQGIVSSPVLQLYTLLNRSVHYGLKRKCLLIKILFEFILVLMLNNALFVFFDIKIRTCGSRFSNRETGMSTYEQSLAGSNFVITELNNICMELLGLKLILGLLQSARTPFHRDLCLCVSFIVAFLISCECKH